MNFYIIKNRRLIKNEINKLDPWYQPINFGYGLVSKPKSKSNKFSFLSSLLTRDRGIRKWKNFIKPILPFSLKGKRILELGTNAGLFLHQSLKEGAREVVGIEKDDHYYSQAVFTSKIFSKTKGGYYPFRIYQNSMENFDYSLLGNFDIALLLAVIYHIGKSADYTHLNKSQIEKLQIDTLVSLGSSSKYQLFQANPLEDEGRGKGRKSLLNLVKEANLEIEKEKVFSHARGYILLTKSNSYNNNNSFTIDKMVNKYFLKPTESAECEFVELYKNSDNIDYKKTKYFKLRTAQADWTKKEYAKIPKNLDVPPKYWVMPWSKKVKSFGKNMTYKRIKNFPKLINSYYDLIDNILNNGFDKNRNPIPGYHLIHPEYGDAFIYTDGNHRMGILGYLEKQNGSISYKIPVKVNQTIRRDDLLNYPLTKQLIDEGNFSIDDVYKWFDNVFQVVKSNGIIK